MNRPAISRRPSITQIVCAGRVLDLRHTAIMGILNVTPDSFSDGGRYNSRDAAIRHAEQLVKDGVDIIDIGGESTRPGAQPLPLQQELDRVIPIVEALSGELAVPLSVDTSKPTVMRESVAAGAGMINDVCALRAMDALATVAELGVPVCLMHMQGEPRTMQNDPQYADVVADVKAFLSARYDACVAAGIAPQHIILDPGFGFGKTVEHNLALLRRLPELCALESPLLVGLSRKSLIGSLLDIPLEQRAAASLGMALVAVHNGARILRVHDVRMTRDAVRAWEAVFAHSG